MKWNKMVRLHSSVVTVAVDNLITGRHKPSPRVASGLHLSDTDKLVEVVASHGIIGMI